MIVQDRFSPPESIRNILIIQIGDIGDLVWATPTFQSVKNAYPDARLSVLVREGNGTLLEADPSIQKIFEVKKYSGGIHSRIRQQLLFIVAWRREKFDLVFDLRSDDRGAIMAFLTGAPIRAALYYQNASRWRNLLFTHLVTPSRENVRTSLGAAEQSLRIVRGFGIETSSPAPKLWIREPVRERMQRLVRDLHSSRHGNGQSGVHKWVTLNPFSRWSYKEWNDDKWIRIIDWLWQDFYTATVIVGSEAERERAGRLAGACKGRTSNMAGRTTLAELAALLSLSSLHLGVDSAAPHIAAAVGVPTVTLYGPTSWRDWAPVGDQHRVVASDMACSPCHKTGCDNQGWSKCLEEMTVETVKETIISVVLPHRSA